jgi:GR25 family glycosyltransferase involved in LPS biosynthesis
MEKQLTSFGFEYERVPGVDGRNLSDDEVAQLYDSESSKKYNKKDLTLGELGCALSHKNCHERALSYDYTLILEDDIELPKNFKEIVEQQITKNKIKKRWDYLQFDYPPTGLIFIKRWALSTRLYFEAHLSNKPLYKKAGYIIYSFVKSLYVIPMSLFEGCRDFIYKKLKIQREVVFYRALYFAGCYLITKDGSKKLLPLEKKIVYVADRIQNQARLRNNLTIKAYCPLSVKQKRQEFGSSILDLKTIEY